jgi:hypothetical protein
VDTPPTLSYADSPIRGELCVDRDEGRVRVIVPPVRDWRLLPFSYKAAALGLAGVIAMLVLGAFRAWGSDDSQALFVNAAIHAVFLAILIAAAHQRIYSCRIFEVTARSLTLTQVSPAGLRSARTWRRSAIAGARIRGDKLIIRIDGGGEVQMFVGERCAAAAVAEALTAALAAVAAAPIADEGSSPPSESEPNDSLRAVFYWLGGGLALLAMGIGLFGDFCVAAYVFLLAAVPFLLAWATD